MRRFTVVRLFAAAAVTFVLAAPAVAETPAAATLATVTAEIEHVIAHAPTQGVAGQPIAPAEARAVYAAFGNAPLWYLEPGTEARRDALESALASAASQGLRMTDLHLAALATLARPTTARRIAERDVLLTDALLRYARQLRRGAAPSEALGADWHIAQEPFDAPKALVDALRGGTFPAFLHDLAPANPQYRLLVAALQQYRTLVGRGGWSAVPGGTEVKLAGGDPRIPALQRRLVAEGYLPASGGDASPGEIALAVRRFQARHGLDADARVGPKTLAALNVSVAERADEIAANLERWRHLPHLVGPRYVAVNLADASLDLFENGSSAFHTRVIVGDVRHQSPSIRATITGVTFNPPWNVPPSIAVKEMLPRLRRDPGYLAANNIMIVGRTGDPFGTHVDWRRISPAGFPFRLQQQPGPKNSLGLLKLEMQNQWNVYLHDTPAKALFERSRRGFSHGCIRVQQPTELARLLLGTPWDADAIAQDIASGVTRTVPLGRPVPVYLLYWTAFVDADGAVNFRDDIYGRDRPIELALGLDHTGSPANELQRVGSCGEPITAFSLQVNR